MRLNRRHRPPTPRPDPADAAFEHAVALHQAGDLAAAAEAYRAIIEGAPGHFAALGNLGALLVAQRAFDDAIVFLERAIAEAPSMPAFHLLLGDCHWNRGRREAALGNFRRAVGLDPKNAYALGRLADALNFSGHQAEAIRHYQAAVDIDSRQPAGFYHNLGLALKSLNQTISAEASLRHALAIEANAGIHADLSALLRERGAITEAAAAARAAIALDPACTAAHLNLGTAALSAGLAQEAQTAYRQVLALDPSATHAHANLLLAMQYDETLSPAEVFEEHRRCGRHFAAVAPCVRKGDQSLDPDRRLTVGYVSADLGLHSVGYFASSPIEHHDRREFRVVCYSDRQPPDWMSQRFAGWSDVWHDTAGLPPDRVLRLIEKDRIDILVDLGAHTGSRLIVFAQRPAPLQVTWLGYPDTTGLDCFDYRIVDDLTDPPGAEAFASERLYRLPEGFLAFQPTEEMPAVGPLPAERAGIVTFGSFNNIAKAGDAVIDAWSRILHRVPHSRLILKSVQVADDGIANRVRHGFAARGIADERVDLIPRITGRDGHLALYNRIDIALDPFPYNGTTTTCEALWMGVPTVVLRGQRHVARVGAALLGRVGLTDLIADDVDGYVATAVSLAEDLPALAGLRARLRDQAAASPLGDGPGFARRLETAYRAMWRRHVAKGAPS